MPAYRNVVGVPATPLFCELVLECTIPQSSGGSHTFTNVQHFFQVTTVPGVSPMNDIVDAWLSQMEVLLEAALPLSYANGKMKGRFMDDPTAGFSTPRGDVDGSVTGDRATSFNAVCIQAKTDARGRNFRGSKHFGPVAESHTTLDDLNAGAITLWQAVADGLKGLCAGNLDAGLTQWTPIILSQTLSDLTANPCMFTYAWTKDYVLNNTVGTMKRRKEKAT